MPTQDVVSEMIEYRIALVQQDSRRMLALDTVDGFRLPRVEIPAWTRPAHQLQRAIKITWNVYAICLDFLPSTEESSPVAVAEVLMIEDPIKLTPIALTQIHHTELSESQRERLLSMLTEKVNGNSAFSQVGWIDKAIAWMEGATGKRLSTKREIEQFNAGGGFSLVRLHTEDDCDYWLKATGKPNAHELSITTYLAKLNTGYLPELVSTKPEWNAWLMSGEATQIPEIPAEPLGLLVLLEEVVESMAKLQMKTDGATLDLLNAGAFDQGMGVFEKHSAALFNYLEEAMSMQISTQAPRLERQRIQDLHAIFEEVCRRMASLNLPETIVHGDINLGNIVTGAGYCQFIDWCETYLGNPLSTLQHLLLLNKVENLNAREFINRLLRCKYRDVWATNYDPHVFEQGFVYMPLMAIVSTLYGRGNWLNSSERNDPHRLSYARTLVRCMDRAAREPELLEALCH
jgi:hypothetical protein